MQKPCRTFLALPLAEEFQESIQGGIEAVKRNYSPVKWVQPDTVHVTLHFFGATDEAELKAIHPKVTELAISEAPFNLGISGIGFFPSAQKPRVIWLGIYGDTERFVRFQALIERELQRMGFVCEDRLFQPHATIGRIKEPLQKVPLINGKESVFHTPLKSFTRLVLYQSQMTPQGSRYEVLQSFPLAGKTEN